MMPQPPNYPTNYEIIPVARPVLGAQPHSHAVLDNAGLLHLEIQLLTPTLVAAGWYGLDARDEPFKEPMSSGGRPIIPGSSIKGACRQIFEVLADGVGPFKNTPRASLDQVIFGQLGHQGLVSFDDAVPVGEVKELERLMLPVAYSPRKKESLGRRFYGLPRTAPGAGPPRTIPGLALPPGTRLRTYLRFTNLVLPEIGLVLLALGLDRSFVPRLGGAKFHGLGVARFEAIKLERFRALGQAPEDATDRIEAAIAAAKSTLSPTGRAALQALGRILQPLPAQRPVELRELQVAANPAPVPLTTRRQVGLLDEVGPLVSELQTMEIWRLRDRGEAADRIPPAAMGRVVAFLAERRDLAAMRKFLGKLGRLDRFEAQNQANPAAHFAALGQVLTTYLDEHPGQTVDEVLYVWSWARRLMERAPEKSTPKAAASPAASHGSPRAPAPAAPDTLQPNTSPTTESRAALQAKFGRKK